VQHSPRETRDRAAPGARREGRRAGDRAHLGRPPGDGSRRHGGHGEPTPASRRDRRAYGHEAWPYSSWRRASIRGPPHRRWYSWIVDSSPGLTGGSGPSTWSVMRAPIDGRRTECLECGDAPAYRQAPSIAGGPGGSRR
jgi:hypothetical protein